MTLSTGDRVGPYEILAQLGVGGMGEVYRARDAKLGRDVALKVLPEAFASDADRMARFQREAKVLASLNHPNIAAIHGVEDSATSRALVMELVEGPTLAERVRAGPIPGDEALRIAKQIADALEYAHERGVVHRDVKPANVKVSSDDAVKVLDFGLAKALAGDATPVDLSDSPTFSGMPTQAGVLLGTAPYMAPEQARGKAVDRRADIWAFGCVLYEMLTGKMTFHGETVTETLAAVIKEEPDWSPLPPETPTRVRVLLQRCLQKDPRQRLRDIGEARILLDEVQTGAPDPTLAATPSAAVPAWRRVMPWALFGATTAALAALAVVHLRRAPAAPAQTIRFQIPLPDQPTLSVGGAPELSPDGRELAFIAATPDGGERLWVRSIDSLEARPLSGSEAVSARPFFWSADSQSIAFVSGRALKKVRIPGGPAETICSLPADALGGSWNRDGVIVFGEGPGVLMRVFASGGTPVPLTVLDPSRGEVLHTFPSFLPDGRHFVYLRTSATLGKSGLYLGSLDAKPEDQDSNELLQTDFRAVYVPSLDPDLGHLLFVRDGALWAQPFDQHRLKVSGGPATVAEHVGTYLLNALFSASWNGVLSYRTSGHSGYQLGWFDGQGKAPTSVGEPGTYTQIELSPDQTRVALTRFSTINPTPALWLLDFARGTTTQLTFGPAAQDPIWSPDGGLIVFGSNRGGVFDLYQKPATGVKDEELLLKSGENKTPTSWSSDGRFLLYTSRGAESKDDLWALPLKGDRKPVPFLRTEFSEREGRFSPDGHWVAYTSDASGREEVYVRAFESDLNGAVSDNGSKWLVSNGGGASPRWREDGKELYYVAADSQLMGVAVASHPVFQAGTPRVLFQVPQAAGGATSAWDVTSDGKRLLMAVAQPNRAPFTIVLNWEQGLKRAP